MQQSDAHPDSTHAIGQDLAPSAQDHPNQFALLRQRRFAPLFWTQFSGAANDNLFKFALTVMVTYQLSVAWLPPAMAGLVIGALFILPFLLFSATSGQLTDKFDKTKVIRFVKNLEIAIMVLAAFGLCGFAVVVGLGAVRTVDIERSRTRAIMLTALVAVAVLSGAVLAESVNGPLQPGHWVMFLVISVSALGAISKMLALRMPPTSLAGA